MAKRGGIPVSAFMLSVGLGKVSKNDISALREALMTIFPENRFDEILKEYVKKIREYAYKHAPTWTGRMRKSMFTKKTGRLEYIVGVKSEVQYAPLVEYGWRLFPVGTPASPRWDWKRKHHPRYPNPRATAPWLRAALWFYKNKLIKDIVKEARRTAKPFVAPPNVETTPVG